MTETKSTTNSLTRPPVVAVLGHVDHGKTSLLDYIRKTKVAAKEVGGITQNIGAYEIEYKNQKLTFIDTPGHEAFTAMRSRGAGAADLAILIVAADDGVKPQTAESIKILKEAKVPFVVAINKIDKNNADVNRAKQDLLSHEVFLEGMGGDVSYQEISATTGQGIDELLDLLLLAAEFESLTYDPTASASGVVVEAKRTKQRGNEVMLILKDGTLKVGDSIFTPTANAKIKIMENFLGERAKELSPSSPALVVGFTELPAVGESFASGEISLAESTPASLTEPTPTSLEITSSDRPVFNFILKADTSGSLEALSQVISALSTEEHTVKIISQSVGEISDGDIREAKNNHAEVIGFQVKISKSATTLADAQKVTIISSHIIYEIIKAIEEAFKKSSADQSDFGTLEVLAVFSSQGSRQTVGGRVVEGILRPRQVLNIKRGDDIIGKARIANLQCNKEDAKEVAAGQDCGLVITIADTNPVAIGDNLIVTSSDSK